MKRLWWCGGVGEERKKAKKMRKRVWRRWMESVGGGGGIGSGEEECRKDGYRGLLELVNAVVAVVRKEENVK